MRTKIHNLLQEDDAVSPVIGVILMVAITVILAAVIASFVLGLGGDSEVQPTTSFNFDYDVNPNDDNTLTITLTDGDSIDNQNLYIRGSANGADVNLNWTEDGIGDEDWWADNGPLSGADVGDIEINTVGGLEGAQGASVSSGQGWEIVGHDDGADDTDIESWDLDIVWDTGDESATLAGDSGSA